MLVEEIIEAKKKVSELKKEKGVVAMDIGDEVHLTREEFLNNFKNHRFSIVSRPSPIFPVEFRIEIEGIKFFCLLDAKIEKGVTNG